MFSVSEKQRKEHDEVTGQILHWSLRPVVKLLAQTAVTPNQLTLLSIFPALASIYFLARGGYENGVLGAALAFLYVTIDALDGQLAREKNLKSILGKWLDGILGYIFVPFMIIATTIGIFSHSQHPQVVLLGAIAAVCYPIQFTLVYYFNSEIRQNSERVELPSTWASWRYLYGLALFFPLLLIGAITNNLILVLWFFALGGNLFWMGIVFIQFLTLNGKKNEGAA